MRPNDLQKMLSRRALVFGGLQALAATTLLTRLYFLQFVHGEEFSTQAEGNRIKLQMLIPPRGVIADRYGVPMALNHIKHRLMLDSDHRKRARENLQLLIPLMKLSDREVRNLTDAIRVRKVGIPLMVREHLTWEEIARIQFHLPTLTAVTIDEGQWRHYPFSEHCSHLLGYIGKVSESEVDKNDPLLSVPDMKIGKNGVEALYEKRIRGTAGTKKVEVNALGSPIRELAKHDAVAGEILPMAIDSRLQEFAIARLGSESGSIVVMDVHSGEVLALVSMPAFDPNEFSKGIKSDYWKALNANIRVPLLNKAIAGQYPPGSTFKMITGLAGLKSGKFNPHQKIYCNGTFYLGNHPFGCWKEGGHGALNMTEAIEQSCDTYFYTVARDVGIDALAAMSKEFGLGAKSGLGLRGEQPGIVPSPEWKMKLRKEPWNPGETINSAIGQGDSLTTPMQLAIMTARLVNGGKKILPKLLTTEPTKEIGMVDVDPAHLALMVEGMNGVINNPRGTAHASAIKEEAYKFGGKTGTSQVRKLLVRGQDQKLVPWEFRHHAWFVGFAPISAPRISCAVMIEHGGGGASAAAPVARDVLRKALECLEFAPGKEPPPPPPTEKKA